MIFNDIKTAFDDVYLKLSKLRQNKTDTLAKEQITTPGWYARDNSGAVEKWTLFDGNIDTKFSPSLPTRTEGWQNIQVTSSAYAIANNSYLYLYLRDTASDQYQIYFTYSAPLYITVIKCLEGVWSYNTMTSTANTQTYVENTNNEWKQAFYHKIYLYDYTNNRCFDYEIFYYDSLHRTSYPILNYVMWR